MSKLHALLTISLITGVSLHAQITDPGYVQTNLVANKADYHPQILDPNMLDSWGIALRPPGVGGHIWISNAHTGTSSEYIGDVNGMELHQDGLKLVSLVPPQFTDHGYPFVTGQVYNSASDIPGQPVEFPVSGAANNNKISPPVPVKGGFSGSAKFVFVTQEGCINAWSANTAVAMTKAPLMIDYSKTARYFPYVANCVFSGVALTNNAATSEAYIKAGGNHLFAADFRNNKIQVFDNKWADVTSKYHFQTPSSVGDLHVFNLADLNGHLFVTYAAFKAAGDEGQEETDGEGLGHVVEYNEDGTLVKDFHTRLALNAPWGMAIAPANFGVLSNKLLVASFGDGTIAAFDLATGEFAGYMRDPDTKIVSIDGIWGLTFGNGRSLGDDKALYFTAGPNGEEDGLFGRLNLRNLSIPKSDASPATASIHTP